MWPLISYLGDPAFCPALKGIDIEYQEYTKILIFFEFLSTGNELSCSLWAGVGGSVYLLPQYDM